MRKLTNVLQSNTKHWNKKCSVVRNVTIYLNIIYIFNCKHHVENYDFDD